MKKNLKNINKIKKEVFLYNQKLVKTGLVFMNFGNMSLRYDDKFIIKPSGVNLNKVKYNDMVLFGKKDKLKPSVDSLIHKQLYDEYSFINSIIHTHSLYATAFSQAGHPLNCYGTTHADFFPGTIPVIRYPNKKEVNKNYEKNIGRIIIKKLKEKKIDPKKNKAILMQNHGVLCWGENSKDAFEIAEIVEKIAELNFLTLTINNKSKKIPSFLLQKHYQRKNSKHKYYGQS